MEVTENDIARIPVNNLRVPRGEFGAVWAASERLNKEQAARGVTNWYAGGVVVTCRWIAGAVVPARNGGGRLAYSPVSNRTVTAYEELIEAEYLAAKLLDVRRPDLLQARPGWCEAVRATLRWAWRHAGPAPLQVPAAAPAPG